MKRAVPLLTATFFGLIALAILQVLPEESVELSQGESVLSCGGSVEPRHSLILQPQSGDIQALQSFAHSLYLDDEQVLTRQCAYEEGIALVVDNLTADEALRLRKAFVGNIQDVHGWIHQRINLPAQTI